MSAQVRPITAADMGAVGEFLHAYLNDRIPANTWACATDVPWAIEQPNRGFMLVDSNGSIVGAYLAFYAERVIDARRERFCNLGAWCVLPEYRLQGLGLFKSLLAQEGLTFTDFSPSGRVPDINAKFGFDFLDWTTWLVPNLPWPSLPGRAKVVTDPAEIEETLSGPELRVYRDHAGARAARHLVLRNGDDRCYVIFRRERRKNLPLFASVLYVSDPARFHRFERQLSRHLLLRYGMVATLVEQRLVSRRPRGSLALRSPRRRMYRSERLQPDQIDYLYSELVCVPW